MSAPFGRLLIVDDEKPVRDVRMPGIDGVEVLKRIRALAATPVIMVTANEDVALARRTLALASG